MINIDTWALRMRNYLNTAVISGVKLLHLTTDELSGLLDDLEAAEKRIAELEARVIVLPQRLSPEGYHIDEAYMVDDTEAYMVDDTEAYMVDDTEGEYLDREEVIDAICAAGIKVKGE